MSKAILIMEMPINCLECPVGKDMSIPLEICVCCSVKKRSVTDAETEKRPDWCPLQEITVQDMGDKKKAAARRSKNYTQEEQNLIDGVEFGIDYGLELSEDDFTEYRRLTEKSE